MGRRTWAAAAAATVLLCWASAASARPTKLLHTRHPIAQFAVSEGRIYWQVFVPGDAPPTFVRAESLASRRVVTLANDFCDGPFCSVALAAADGRAWWEVESQTATNGDASIFTASDAHDERTLLSTDTGGCDSVASSPVARSGVALLTVFTGNVQCTDTVGGTVYASTLDAPRTLRRLPTVPAPAVLGSATDPSRRDVLALATASGRLAVIRNPLRAPMPSTVTVRVRTVATGQLVTSFDVTGTVESMAMTRQYVILSVALPHERVIRWYGARTGELLGSHAVHPGISPLSASGSRVVYSRDRQIRLLNLVTKRASRLRLCARLPRDVQIDGRLVAWSPRDRNLRGPGSVFGLRLTSS